MRIKFLSVIAAFLFVSFALSSCLDDDNEVTEYSSDATIYSFSLNNIKTTLIEGTDTASFTVTGSKYIFTIDQKAGTIYNRDSLPYRTDVSKVVINITTTGGPVYINNEDSLWISSDSLNFSKANSLENAVRLIVHAPDWHTTRTYRVWINVHQQDGDTLIWNKLPESDFPGSSITGKQKAVCMNGKIFVFAQNGSNVGLTSTSITDGKNWTELTDIPLTDADYSSATVFQNKIYLIAGEKLYASADGISWTQETHPENIDKLVAPFHNQLIGIHNEYFIQSPSWESGLTVPEGFPQQNIASVSYPLSTNPAITRLITIGEESALSDTSTVVWSMLSDENKWFAYVPDGYSKYDCPKLENIALIHYDNSLFVFGGKGIDNGKEVKAFQSFYRSTDNGISWKPQTLKTVFPQAFLGRENPFSYVVDDKGYLWIFWSGLTEVWKGRINRLGFEQSLKRA